MRAVAKGLAMDVLLVCMPVGRTIPESVVDVIICVAHSVFIKAALIPKKAVLVGQDPSQVAQRRIVSS